MASKFELEQAEDAALYRLLRAYLCILRGDYKNARVYVENALESVKYLENFRK